MKDLKKETLKKIQEEKIKPKPKTYFQIIKGVLYGSSLILLILAIYVVNLTFYLPARTTRIVEKAGINEYLSLFPWPLLIVGAIIVGTLIYVYRNYEGGYKNHLLLTILAVFLLVLVGGGALAKSSFNEMIENRPGFKRFYEWNDENFVPKGPKRRLRIHKQEIPTPEKTFLKNQEARKEAIKTDHKTLEIKNVSEEKNYSQRLANNTEVENQFKSKNQNEKEPDTGSKESRLDQGSESNKTNEIFSKPPLY